MMCVHHSALARPGDLCGPLVVARAKHVTFLPATDKLPRGGALIALEEDKGNRLMGTNNISQLQVLGTGTTTCPVLKLKQVFDVYSLHRHGDEPIFASMQPDGKRIGPPGATTGASVISNPEYNRAIQGLFKRAGLPRFTARGARAARKIELSCAGVADPVVTTLGRWHDYQSSRPYDAQSIALLEHVARVLGIKPAAIMAPAAAAPQQPQEQQRKRQRSKPAAAKALAAAAPQQPQEQQRKRQRSK